MSVLHLVVEVIVDTPEVEAGVERVLLEEARQLLAVVVEGPGQVVVTQGTRKIWYDLTTSYPLTQGTRGIKFQLTTRYHKVPLNPKTKEV